MLKIHIYKRIENLEHLPILDYYFGSISFGKQRTGDMARKSLGKQYFLLTENPDDADYLLVPHSYFHIKDKSYLDEFVDFAKKNNKKTLIFSYGDSDEEIVFPSSIIFRSSQYRYKLKKNEVIFPAIADDLLVGRELVLREKSLGSSKPLVGFCGWANFENPTRRIREYIKVLLLWLKKYILIDKYSLLHKRGILFRRQAISVLKSSSLVNTNFIIRDSYSGSEKTRKLSAEQSQSEYINNILDSDLALAIKGDGNFSIRLYEILSLGRIPLYIDTDCVLPLEDIIDYSKFMIKISSDNIKDIGKIAQSFYENVSPNEFKQMQLTARKTFEDYLRVEKYADYVFLDPERTLLKKYD